MSEKYQYFNGLKFTRDDKTGYYLNSTIRKRMHRYVWEFYNGQINPCIVKNGMMNTQEKGEKILQKRLKRQRIGTKARRGKSGIQNMRWKHFQEKEL